MVLLLLLLLLEEEEDLGTPCLKAGGKNELTSCFNERKALRGINLHVLFINRRRLFNKKDNFKM